MDDFINIQNFEEQETIIVRDYCKIYKVLNKKTGCAFSLEKLKNPIKNSSQHELLRFCREVNTISKLNHPSILKFLSYIPKDYAKQQIPMIATEFCTNTTLEAVQSKNHSILNDTKKLIIIYGLASGLSYLHSHEILHCNVHPSNIILDSSFYPKLCNFGSSRVAKKDENDDYLSEITWLTTPRYMAPEVWMNKNYQKSSDIYSFSILFYELMTNDVAFSDFHDVYGLINQVLKGKRPSKINELPESYRKLIEDCWDEKAENRPSFDEIARRLREDKGFITENVDEEEYRRYIEQIESSNISFESKNEDINIDFNQNQVNKSVLFDPNYYFKDPLNLKHILNLDDYEKSFKLGQATESESFILIDKKTGEEYVGKTSLDEFSTNDYERIIKLSFDVNKFLKINHPSFVKYIGYSPTDFDNEYRPVIITKFVPSYTLEYLIDLESENKSPANWNMTKKLINIYGIATAMSYLHSHNIVHQTLNTCNVLLNEYLVPIIAGVGSFINTKMSFAELFNQEQHKFSYFAPEYMESLQPTKPMDVYSFAVIVFEMFTNQKIFTDDFSMNTIIKIIHGMRPKIPDNIPKIYRELIETCWNHQAEKRPTFEEIVNHIKNNFDEFITDEVIREDFMAYANFVDNYFLNEPIEKYINTESITFQKIKLERKEKKLSSFNIESINLEKYEKNVKIGEGSFGIVFKIFDKQSNKACAAKISKAEINNTLEDEMVNISREVNILSKVNHPSIIEFIGYSPTNFKDQMRPVIITDFYNGGSLEEIIELERKSCSKFGWDETKKLINIYGIASGLQYLHSRDIIHRDIRPDNILLDDLLYPKISDFGLSKNLNDKRKNEKLNSGLKGTPAYIAPEIWNKFEYKKPCDVYAFAFTVYEIVTNQKCFSEFPNFLIFYCEVILPNKRPEFKYPIPNCYKKLIEDCWSLKPENRPTFDEIVKELETNPEFITELVDKEEYYNYIKYIKQCTNSTFSPPDSPVRAEKEIKNRTIFNNERKSPYKNQKIIKKGKILEIEKVIEEELNISDDEKQQIEEQMHLSISEEEKEKFKYEHMIKEEEEYKDEFTHTEQIDKYIKTRNSKDLMLYLEKNCDNEKISDIFDFCYKEMQEFYVELCKEGVSQNNVVSHHKYANWLIFNELNKKNCTKYISIAKEAQHHLEYCIENGYLMSYFTLARLMHEVLHDDERAYKYAEEGSELGEKNCKFILGYYITRGIGKQPNQFEGIQMMLSSGAEHFYNQFYTDFGIYFASKVKQKPPIRSVQFESTNHNFQIENKLEDNEDEENMKKAFEYFEKAFNYRKTKATINNLGTCFMIGFGVKKDIEKAKLIFKEGESLGDSNTICNLSFTQDSSLLANEFQQQNITQINSKFENKIISKCDIQHKIDEGIKLYKLGEFEQSLKYFIPLVEINHPIAKYFYGIMKFFGQGCKEDRNESYEVMSYLSKNGIDKATQFIEQYFH